jgi:menaquinone-dependent protoporphyrinogen oxidase
VSTIIIYASSHGTTAKAANILCEKLGGHIPIVDLKKTKQPDIKKFDAVIIGGSIHAGMMQRKVTKFIKHNEQELMTKKVGLFLCCMYDGEQANNQFEQAYPEGLRNHSLTNGLFGGEFLFGKMNFLEKTIIKKLKGDTADTSTLDEEAISQFAEKFQASSLIE